MQNHIVITSRFFIEFSRNIYTIIASIYNAYISLLFHHRKHGKQGIKIEDTTKSHRTRTSKETQRFSM